MNRKFKDCQFDFMNWLRENNAFHGARDVWRLNSFNMNCVILNEHQSDSERMGISRNEKCDVRGRERAKYFHHVTSSAVNFVPLPFDTEDYECKLPTITEKTRDIGVQTKYRESSAQTVPYEPDFIRDPEGKYLETEIYTICRGIKDIEEPGLYEVKLIERLKRRRALEKILNKSKSKVDLERYRKVVETFEWEEWVAREEDIQYYQNLRLQMIRDLLSAKDKKMRDNSDEKVICRIEKIKKHCADEMSKIQSKYNRNMRKIEYKRKNICRKYPKTDILLEHTRMDSELYGPQMRYGVHPKRRHFVGYKTKFDLRMEDLEKKITKPTVVKCPFAFINMLSKPKEPPKEFTTSFLADKRLQMLYESLKYFRIQLEPKRETPKCLKTRKSLSSDTLQATVFGVDYDLHAEEEYQNCVFLQKLIKGRAIQSILYTGKEEFKGLINEMDSTHSLRAVEALFPDLSNEKEIKKAQTLARQKYSEQILNDNTNLKTLIRDFEGSIIGPLFEFLEKELDRLYEEKRVQAIVLLAERERYKREAKEAGNRQYENRLREQYVETYTHMMKSTKDNISTYLEDVLLEEINMKASIDSRRKITLLARVLDRFDEDKIKNPTLNSSEKKANEEKVIADVINDFLFSSVHNQLARQNVLEQRKKNIETIHNCLYAEYRIAEDVLNDIITEIIHDVVKCQSPEKIHEEELKFFVRNIIKDVCEDTIDPTNRSIAQIMEYIMNSIFDSDHYSVFMDSCEKKDFVVNIIMKELKQQIGYEVLHDQNDKSET